MTTISNNAQLIDASQETLAVASKAQFQEWWRGAVIYQVYPRSFKDSNGDGIGDLKGIISKLGYIADLGVDALWISPFYKSPMKDFGYDISDFRDVDPMFGTLADFDELVNQAKQRGLKIMVDQVLSHTSDQHPWFAESRRDRTNPKSDWYVWADAKPDGSAPNNWLSIFGGKAWTWDSGREQYYLHNFLSSQPDLNYHNDGLRAQILNEIEFWLKRGVDGFRLDAINFCYHDKKLRDNPIKPVEETTGRGFSPNNPYALQYHYYDNNQPENLAFLEDIRTLLDAYPGCTTLGEINSENSLKTMVEYTNGDRLNMGYNFELLADDFSSQHIKETIESIESVIDQGWPCWAVSNHDVTRVVSRWGCGEHQQQFAKMVLSLTGTLRGTLCVYQGEELGFTEAELNYEQLQDPYGLQFWPEFKGRDGCRTPIAWNNDEPFAGFSNTNTWLPLAPEHIANNVDDQLANPNSVLNYYRAFLAWRREQPALTLGDIEVVEASTQLLVISRRSSNNTILACFNLSNQALTWEIGRQYQVLEISERSSNTTKSTPGTISLGAYGFAFLC